MKTPNNFIDYKNEIKLVKEYLEVKDVYWSMAECYIMWEAFSDRCSAQFLCVDDEWLDLFWDYLNEE